MNILIISRSYPTRYKVIFPFVQQLVEEMGRQGHHCYVITPFSVTSERRFYKQKETILYESGGSVTVLRPNYFSVSKLHIGAFKLSGYLRTKAVQRAFKWIDKEIDFVYCHFWQSAKDGFSFAHNKKIPLFVATGESCITNLYSNYKEEAYVQNYVSGVICVSTKNQDESVDLGLTTLDKCFVSPNSINNRVFRLMDKKECRRQLGFPQDAFIIISVGSFIERKGMNRIANAISSLNSNEVYSVFIGEGPVEPQCNNILYKGKLLHDQIPTYLNAADVFVLPTQNEGCCNAIIEAMACGLPIISSNLPFNWDVLDATNSIMIDPNNIKDIAKAINMLYSNRQLLGTLSEGAINRAKSLTIDKRTSNIIDFCKQHAK